MTKILSNRALEIFVKDEKTEPMQKSLHVQTLHLKLSQELTVQLNELHAQGKNVNELLAGLLQERKEKIEQKKEELSKNTQTTSSRYIPVAVRAVIEEEYGQKCSIKTCLRMATEIHHSQRYSLAGTHDPKYLAPFCAEHHKIAHTIDQKVHAHWS